MCLADGRPAFVGITTYIQKTSEKVVLPMDIFSIVQYEYMIDASSSVQWLFAFSRHFLSVVMIVLLEDYTYHLPEGSLGGLT